MDLRGCGFEGVDLRSRSTCTGTCTVHDLSYHWYVVPVHVISPFGSKSVVSQQRQQRGDLKLTDLGAGRAELGPAPASRCFDFFWRGAARVTFIILHPIHDLPEPTSRAPSCMPQECQLPHDAECVRRQEYGNR